MKHRSSILLGAVTVVLATVALLLSTIVVPGAALAKPAVKTVVIKNMTFMPQKITVNAGTKVTWVNKDSVSHNVTSAKSMSTTTKTTKMFASALLSKGQKFSFTFKKKGTFFYECTIHAFMASMHGQVTVK